MSNCIFCQIVAGNAPAYRIFEDEEYLAFLDIFPAVPGHTLVIPKRHSADIHSLSSAEYGELASRAKIVADLLREKLAPDGMTIFQMNREAGWQSVFHAHFHLLPRSSDDLLQKPWQVLPAPEDDLRELQARIMGRASSDR